MRLEIGVLFEELDELNDRSFLGQTPKSTVLRKEFFEFTFGKGLPLGFGKCGEDIRFCYAQSRSWCHLSLPRRNSRFHQYIHSLKCGHYQLSRLLHWLVLVLNTLGKSSKPPTRAGFFAD